MADRVGVINKGEIILVEDKRALMKKLGQKQLAIELAAPLAAVPDSLSRYRLTRAADGRELVYTYDTRHEGANGEPTGITALLDDLKNANIRFRDLRTSQSSLEDIFVSLVRK
jgi:ABC-2 type transport system ATP-binding protein